MSKWIQINNNHSKPMPEERKVYLVTYQTPSGRRYVRDLQTNYVGISPPYIGWSKKINGKVVAWMKLPDPYQEAKHYPTKKEHKTKDYEGTPRPWLVKARKNNKLTQAVTAKLIGVTQEAYSMYERGVRIPRPLVAKRIAEVLGINWTWFYDRVEEVAGDG